MSPRAIAFLPAVVLAVLPSMTGSARAEASDVDEVRCAETAFSDSAVW